MTKRETLPGFVGRHAAIGVSDARIIKMIPPGLRGIDHCRLAGAVIKDAIIDLHRLGSNKDKARKEAAGARTEAHDFFVDGYNDDGEAIPAKDFARWARIAGIVPSFLLEELSDTFSAIEDGRIPQSLMSIKSSNDGRWLVARESLKEKP